MRRQLDTEPRVDFARLSLVGNFVLSLGIIMVTSGGSWDITNHILNKPETFFAPPHAVLYSGVGIALLGFLVLYTGWKKSGMHHPFRKGIRLSASGIGLLLAAGPADFVWHSNFGLDGLLSPPHLVLISGMILSCVGALVNSAKYLKQQEKSSRLLTVVSLIPVWLAVTGLFYSFSLPFSETEYFDFNPHPWFAAAFASFAYPFLISSILVMASALDRYRFGTASAVGISYLGIMSLTALAPNESLVDTVPFYLLSVIPLVVGDLLISKSKNKTSLHLAGATFGSAFFFLYFPLITYTYNEVVFQRVLWPSLTSLVYFETVPLIAPALICIGAAVGLLGAKFSSKLMKLL